MNTIYLFTYGLLTNKSIMGEHGTYVGIGLLNDHKLEILSHANVIKNDNSTVKGIVWEIPEDNLSYFDMIEGYPYYYYRFLQNISINDKTIIAYVYKMTDDSRKKYIGMQPCQHYLDDMITGYDNLIPISQITSAMENICY